MNGYAWPTYGAVRYMQPILTAQDAPVSIYDAFPVLYGPPPGVTPAWAEAGTIPPLTLDDIPFDGSGEIEETFIPGGGVPALDEGVLVPTAPVTAGSVDGWTPTGFVDMTLADDGEYPWRIYVGGYLIEKWSNGRLRLALGRASTLEFTREDSAGNRAVFTLTNPIELRNSYGLLVDVFEISVLRQQREPDKALLHIEAIGSLSRLGLATVLEYSTPVDAETGARSYMRVRDVVAGLFAYQSADYPLAIGEIDPAIGDRDVIWSCEACTILGALEQLQQHLPIEVRGHYFVVPDDSGVLQFRWILGDSGIPMTMDTETNLSGIEYSQDFTQIITRLYLRGQQEELGTRVDLPAPGYLSRNEATYGVRAAAKIDNRILYQESLVAYGERLLDEYSTPRTELRVTAINTKIGGHDARFVTLGTRYDVTDAISEVTVSVVAQEIEYDLDDPLSLSLTLSSRTRDMADVLADIMSQENEATPPIYYGSGTEFPDPPLVGFGIFYDETGDGQYYGAQDGSGWLPLGSGGAIDIDPVELAALLQPGTDIQSVGEANDPGTVPGVGEPDTYARDDHIHAGAQPGGYDIQDVGIENDGGESDLYAREDHVHAGVWLSYDEGT
jgi:hypothetical protein